MQGGSRTACGAWYTNTCGSRTPYIWWLNRQQLRPAALVHEPSVDQAWHCWQRRRRQWGTVHVLSSEREAGVIPPSQPAMMCARTSSSHCCAAVALTPAPTPQVCVNMLPGFRRRRQSVAMKQCSETFKRR